jgi:hypothetical protein
MSIYIVGLERHDQRYTSEWAEHLPRQLRQALPKHEVCVIEGAANQQETTPGAFLNFAATNIYKSQQTEQIAALFESGQMKPGDTLLFSDAWHFGICATRYMSDLLSIPVRIVSLWHSGQYDPFDFLGRIADRAWAQNFERAVFAACEVNVFATQFHIDLFLANHKDVDTNRILRAGWPMEYLRMALCPIQDVADCNLVLFPHRIAPEKQVEIFRDLAGEFPDFEFRVCQDEKLTKQEYHNLLGRTVAVFSASNQETLGIGLYEGLLCGAMPIAPNRLSYKEMYPRELLYPSEWTTDWTSYQRRKGELVKFVHAALCRAKTDTWRRDSRKLAVKVGHTYFDGSHLYQTM